MTKLADLKNVHMVGIKGTGMSVLALILRSLGVEVSGSDSADSFLLLDQKNFDRARISITTPFDAKNVPKDADAIISSTSHDSKNVELTEARKRGIPVLTYPKIVGMLTETFPSYAVCGSHGKTTTTNMLGFIMCDNDIPALVLGGPTSQQVLNTLSSNISSQPPLTLRGGAISPSLKVREGCGEIFIFEADEYQNKLAYYHPRGVILTNVEFDHPDFFKSEAEYEKVFVDFIKRIPRDGWLVYCAGDAGALRIAKHATCKTIPHGLTTNFPYGKFVVRPKIQLLGTHNQLNAMAAALAAKELGLSETQIQKSLAKFKGAHRRMEKVSDNPLIIDDYGHHPTEIKATLRAIREAYPDKEIWTVFHPHTFTRTKKFLTEFGESFKDSDHTVVLDIYASAREITGDVHAMDVVNEINKNKRRLPAGRQGDAYYCATFDQAAAFLKPKLNRKTLLLTIGAGDVWKLHKLIT